MAQVLEKAKDSVKMCLHKNKNISLEHFYNNHQNINVYYSNLKFFHPNPKYLYFLTLFY